MDRQSSDNSGTKSPARPKSGRGARKTIAFILMMVGLILLVLEVGARILEAVFAAKSGGGPAHAFVDYKNPVKAFELSETGGRKVYRRTEHHTLDDGQQFSAEKGERTFRVFCLGGSAAQGWPHAHPDSFPGLLGRQLELVLPDWNIEVVNAAGWSYASHRVRFVFDEIIEYQPDLIVIYSGNNEFLEQIVYGGSVRELSAPWKYSAIARIVHRALGRGGSSKSAVDMETFNEMDQVPTRLSWAFGKASPLRRDPEQFAQVKAHYAYNIESMVSECQRRGVPVFLLTVPGNLKDWIPNVSVHAEDLSPEGIDGWQGLFRKGVLALEAGEFATAAGALREAARVSADHAETHYHLARAYHRLGQLPEAKVEYRKALEYDAYPFRPLPQFNEILFEIAETHGVRLIDIVSILQQRTEDGVIGLDVLIDYVHPTVTSNEVIAHAILVEMGRAGLLPEELAVPVEEARIEVPEEAGDTLQALRGLFAQNLVMRQHDKLDELVESLAAKLNELVEARPDFRPEAQRLLSRYVMGMQIIRPYRRLLRAEKLGTLQEEFTDAEAQKIFSDYVGLIQRIEGLNLKQEEFDEYVPERPLGRQ